MDTMHGTKTVCFFSLLPVVLGIQVHEMEIASGLGKFSWSNCNKTVAPVAFSALSVSPAPLQFGQNMTLSFSLHVSEDIGITSTLQVDVEATLNVHGTPIDLCNYGSMYCHMTDICKILSKHTGKCPAVIRKVIPNGCQCPLKKNTYTVKDAVFALPTVPMTVDGDLHVAVHLKESDKPVGCLDVHICLGSC